MSASSAKPRAVVDTNLFVSGAISPTGSPRRLLQAWTSQRFHLVISDRQATELRDVFARPGLVAIFQLPWREVMALLAEIEASPRVPLTEAVPVSVRDPKDEHLLAAALGGEADYLVSGDKDLLVLAGDPALAKLKIVTAGEFMGLLDQLAQNQADE